TDYLHTEWSEKYSVKVAENVFLRNDFPDLARKRIATAKLGSKKYVYSDLNFILLKDIVEKITGEGMDEYLTEHFYFPMGLRRTGFNPREFIEDANIAPTEDDHYFRNQVLQGYVHDQSAAIFGGVSGNAGLFSTAQEVSVLLSMLMNGGKYEGVSYLSEETVRFFEATYPLHGCKRRGLGFDTPSFAEKNPVLPSMAGSRTFGHQGFTGTVFWCDPDNDLIYIFLSNRVYPNAEPNNLSKSRLRLTVHEEIYKGLGIN
ncbi:MAG: serine hydrolase, partial [Bacteroidales bacterium]|nr:serine hydrolase [Bacteroidales bacterium]